MVIIIVFLLTEKGIYKFKENKNINLPIQFCLGSISSKFDYFKAEKYLQKEMCMTFELIMIFQLIHKSDILNIHKYLMLKNNIK